MWRYEFRDRASQDDQVLVNDARRGYTDRHLIQRPVERRTHVDLATFAEARIELACLCVDREQFIAQREEDARLLAVGPVRKPAISVIRPLPLQSIEAPDLLARGASIATSRSFGVVAYITPR